MSALLVGTYTETLPHVRGVADGIVTLREGAPAVVTAVRNPSWLVADGLDVYAVSETADAPSTLHHLTLENGALRHRQQVTTGGVEAAHLTLTEHLLLVANYGSGSVAVIAREPDGSLGAMLDLVTHAGSSVHPVRQAGAHPHQVIIDPVSGELLVCDLGLDAVVRYAIGPDGRLRETGRLELAPGSGPRHLAFHPDGAHLLVLGELDNTITVFRDLEVVFSRSTLPAEFDGPSAAAEITVSADGRFVYASNRGHDSIAILAWPDLGPVAHVPSGGRTPRHILLADDDRRLLVANQDSNTIVTFARGDDGTLERLDSVGAPTPVCLVRT